MAGGSDAGKRPEDPQEKSRYTRRIPFTDGRQRSKQPNDPSEIARRVHKELGVPQKSRQKPLDVIKTLFHTPLVPPDAQAKANDAQAKANAEAEAEARKEGLGNSLSQSPEITQKHERQKKVRLHEILAQSLVEDIDERGKLERGIAKESRQELSLKNRREDPKLQGKKKLAQRGLLQVREWWSSIKRASLERAIRAKTKDINDMLDKIEGAEETARNSLTLQDGPLKLQMKERVPYSTGRGLHYGSDDFEMPRFSHLTLKDINDDLRSQSQLATGDAVRARLKKFRNYYVKLSILQKTEQGYRAQEGICLAKSHKLRFEIQDLQHHRSHLVNTRREIFRDAHLVNTRREIFRDAHSDILDVTDALYSISRNIDAYPITNAYNTDELNAVDHHIGAIDKDIQSKFVELASLEHKNLKSIQSHITKIQGVYKSLERHDCHSLMERLIYLEKQHPSASSSTDEITVTWAAIPKKYQFVHPVKRYLEKALPPIPVGTRSGTGRQWQKTHSDRYSENDAESVIHNHDPYSVNNWGNMSGYERRKWEKRTEKARATTEMLFNDPDYSPTKNQYLPPLSNIHKYTYKTFPEETYTLPLQSSSGYPYDARRELDLDLSSPLSDLGDVGPDSRSRDPYSYKYDSDPPTPKQAFSNLRPTFGTDDSRPIPPSSSKGWRKPVPLFDPDASGSPPPVPDKDVPPASPKDNALELSFNDTNTLPTDV